MGIVVFSILVGISVPIYSNYQTQLNQDKIDSALITAGSLIEREAIDNNGLYATYLPSEISDNSDFEDIIYTYNDDRTVWCLQTNGDPRRYISSTDPDTVSSVVCTQKNIATGSAIPWEEVDVTPPTIGSASNVWTKGENVSEATIVVVPSTACSFSDNDDQTVWSQYMVTEYSARITNVTTGDTYDTNWSTSTTISSNFPSSWIPKQTLTYEVAVRCTIQTGAGYVYTSNYSTAVSDTVDSYDIPAPVITNSSVSFSNNVPTVSITTTTSDLWCSPTATSGYRVVIKQGTSTLYDKSIYPLSNSISISNPSNSLKDNSNITIYVYSLCKFTNGTVLSSPSDSTTTAVPLAPAPAVKITSINDDKTKQSTPSAFTWGSASCYNPDATIEYQLVTTSGLAFGWTTSTSQSVYYPSVVLNTTYEFKVQTRCALNGSYSDVTTGEGKTQKIVATTADAPSKPTNVTLTFSPSTSSSKSGKVTWSGVTCKTGFTAQYKVTVASTNMNQTNTTSWFTGTTYSVDSGWLTYGATYKATVEARCINWVDNATASSSSGGTVSGANTVDIPTPSKPTSLTGSNRTFSWTNPSCVTGTTAQVYAQQTLYGDTWGTWNLENWSTDSSTTLSQYLEGYKFTAEVQARCVNTTTNVTSSNSGYASESWIASLSAPKLAWECINPNGSGPCRHIITFTVSCPTGSSPTSTEAYVRAWDTSRYSSGPLRWGYGWGYASPGRGTTYGYLNDRSWGWWEAYGRAKCQTPWATSSYSYVG